MPRLVRNSATVTYVAGILILSVRGDPGRASNRGHDYWMGYATIHLYAPAATLVAIAP